MVSLDRRGDLPGRREGDGHCESHERFNETMRNVEIALAGIQSRDNTIYKTAGAFLAGFTFVIGILGYIWNTNNSNMSSNVNNISSDIKEIKAYIATAREYDAKIDGRIANIEYRIQAHEGRK